jgi:hypothetical protein
MRVRYLPVAEGRRLHIDAFPNFSASGSVKGMKEKYYGKDAFVSPLWQLYLLRMAESETVTVWNGNLL